MAEGISKRTDKLQLMLSPEELEAIDNWRFAHRLPSRAAAIRELITRGLNTQEFDDPEADKSSGEYVVTDSLEDENEPGKA